MLLPLALHPCTSLFLWMFCLLKKNQRHTFPKKSQISFKYLTLPAWNRSNTDKKISQTHKPKLSGALLNGDSSSMGAVHRGSSGLLKVGTHWEYLAMIHEPTQTLTFHPSSTLPSAEIAATWSKWFPDGDMKDCQVWWSQVDSAEHALCVHTRGISLEFECCKLLLIYSPSNRY